MTALSLVTSKEFIMARLDIDTINENNPLETDSVFLQTAGGEDYNPDYSYAEYDLVFSGFTVHLTPKEAVKLCSELRRHLIVNNHSELSREITRHDIEWGNNA